MRRTRVFWLLCIALLVPGAAPRAEEDPAAGQSSTGFDFRPQVEGTLAFTPAGGQDAAALIPTASWNSESNQAYAYYGTCVASAGDVNDDGYDDVIVGAPSYDNGQTDEGRAYLFLGSATGLQATPAWTMEVNQANAHFGAAVACGGDLNQDGYGDVLIGAPFYDNGQTNEGCVFVYYGTSTGLATTAYAILECNQADAQFGTAIACADFDNDEGNPDALIGAPYYDNGQTNEGRVFLFRNQKPDLSTSADWTVESNQAEALFGSAVASAGDVNHDGMIDLMIGAPYYDNGQADEGRAYVYHGRSYTVPLTTPTWTAESNQAGARFGHALAGAGDLQRDNYADVIIGAPLFDNVQTDEGKVLVYIGSAGGLEATAAWTFEGDQDDAEFGSSVAGVGDVNGDTFPDVAVGLPLGENDQTDEGHIYVFRARPSGYLLSWYWAAEGNQANAHLGACVAGAGDVNNDNVEDLLVSAPLYDNGQTDEGRAYMYLGGGDPGYQWALDTSGYWHTATNWSPQSVPDDGASVIINRPGVEITVTHSQGSTEVSDLVCEENLAVTGGALWITNGGSASIAGNLTLGSGATLTTFPGSLTVLGGVLNQGANLYAGHATSTVVFPGSVDCENVGNYVQPSGITSTWESSGDGSSLTLSGMSSVYGSGSGALLIKALSGGVVDLPAVSQITIQEYAGTNDRCELTSAGLGSVIQLPLLTSFSAPGGHSKITPSQGGTVEAPNLASLNAVSLILDGTGAMPTSQIISYTMGTATISGQSVDFTGMQNVSGSSFDVTGVFMDLRNATTISTGGRVKVQGGGTADISGLSGANGTSFIVGGGVTLSAPAVTSYAQLYTADRSLEASGIGSWLELPNLTVINGGSTGGLLIKAIDGGTVNLPLVGQIYYQEVAGVSDRCELTATGPGSVIQLPLLTSFSAPGGHSKITPSQGGTVAVPNLTSLNGVSLILDGTGTMPTGQIASYTMGTATISGQSVDFTGMQNVSGSSFDVTGVFMDLRNATTISTGGRVKVQGGGTADISGLSGANGTSFIVGGGVTLSAPAVTSYAQLYAADRSFEASGIGSRLEFPNLTAISGGSSRGLLIKALDGGIVDLPMVEQVNYQEVPGDYDRCELSATGVNSIVILTSISSFNGQGGFSKILANTGGTISFRDGSGTTIIAGTDIKIDPSGTILGDTLLMQSTSRIYGTGRIDASLGGAIRMYPGDLSAGDDARGTLTIGGDFRPALGSILYVDVSGTGPGGSDVVVVEGEVILGGTVSVEFVGGYVPPGGAVFPILTAGAVSGQFADLQIESGPDLYLTYGPTSVSLVIGSVQFPYSFYGPGAGDQLGYSVDQAGDVNGDGAVDLIVGSPYDDNNGTDSGSASVYSGATGQILYTWNGDSASDSFGYCVSGAGDVNNDGRDDLIVGAYYDDFGGTDAGSAYVYSGLDGALLYTFHGTAAGDYFGISVNGAGDVDNDGYDDVIIGASQDDAPGTDQGSAWVYSGLDGSQMFSFAGISAGDRMGRAIASIDDLNGDGQRELLVGAPYDDDMGSNSGTVSVLDGRMGTQIYLLKPTATSADTDFGRSVADAGDVNGDGYHDILVGAPYDDDNGTDSGTAWIFSGQNGSLLFKLTGEGAGDYFGWGIAPAGDLNADGLADVLVGAHGDDNNGADSGSLFIFSGGDGSLMQVINGAVAGDQFAFAIAGGFDLNLDSKADWFVGIPKDDVHGTDSGSAQVFAGGSNTASVSGTVTLQGQSDHSGVLVRDTMTRSVTYTDVAGHYTLNGLFAGPHAVTASKTGFTTESLQITLAVGQAATGIDFALEQMFETQQCRTPALAIPDNNPAGVYDDMTVAIGGTTVMKVEVYVNITHTYKGDLIVKLVSPQGTNVTLHNRTGGSGDNIVGWVPAEITPAQSLDAFVGEPTDGVWRLFCSDNAAGITGTLNQWCLKLTHGAVTAAPDGGPDLQTRLIASHPNPFGSETSIRYELARPGEIDLAIFDVTGRRIATLATGICEAGTRDVVWDGRNARGERLPNGIYFCRLTADGREMTTRLVLVLGH